MLIVKRATSITGELWAAFTAVGAASTLAEIAISRVRSPKQLRGVESGLGGSECLFMAALSGQIEMSAILPLSSQSGHPQAMSTNAIYEYTP